MQAFYSGIDSRISIFGSALNKCKNYCLLLLCSPVALSLTGAVSFLCQVAVRWQEQSREMALFSLKETITHFSRITKS